MMRYNPAEALDAVKQALQEIWSDVDTEEHYKTVPRVTEAIAHIATLRQQVAELVAYAKACYPMAQGPDWEEQHPIIKQFAPAADGGQGA